MFRRTRARRLLPALSAALLVLAACGPIEYINQVSRKASAEVEAAKAVKADKYAPYWYTLAVEYLAKAREEAAEADFQAANRFGRRSARAATRAHKLAIERARAPEGNPDLVPDDADFEIEAEDPSGTGENPLDDEEPESEASQ